jgi:hypothetical protein
MVLDFQQVAGGTCEKTGYLSGNPMVFIVDRRLMFVKR